MVLIGLVDIQIPGGRLRNPPRHVVRAAVGDLDRHGFPCRFVEQRVCIGALEKKGHQVFEHRPGPTEQHPAPADGAVGPAHGKPMLGGNVPPGNGDETSEARFARQEVIDRRDPVVLQ